VQPAEGVGAVRSALRTSRPYSEVLETLGRRSLENMPVPLAPILFDSCGGSLRAYQLTTQWPLGMALIR
jgi:hypothetical protein